MTPGEPSGCAYLVFLLHLLLNSLIMNDNFEDLTLHELFKRISENMMELMNGSDSEDSRIDKVVAYIDHCAKRVHSEALFSKNESVDDIQTHHLKVS